jgi:hypothetical protein
MLKFIKTKPAGNREIAYILLLNPLRVCAQMRREKRQRVSEEWWNAFVARAKELGATIDLDPQEGGKT